MKTVFKDYYNDLKEYYIKVKRKIKKGYRKIKYYWNTKVVPLFFDYKEYILRKENRTQNLTILGSFIILFLFMLVAYPSYAYYNNEFEFSVLGSVVGNTYSNKYDYTLLVYIEDATSGMGNGQYNLTSDIPTFGYSYSGYKCENGSTLNYDESTKLTSVTTDQRDVCSIYFDLTTDSDIGITIMLEDEPDSNIYTSAKTIPYYGYTYSHYECDNNSTLTYDSNLHEVYIETESQEYCRIYFQKEKTDIEVNLFVENTYNTGDYLIKNSIPANTVYSLNEENSVCFNELNERIETSISYADGAIQVSTGEVAYCEVYLDIANE